jgi:anti-anti-sigma regulatory factor
VTNARITHMDLQLSRALICVDGELDLADVGEFKVGSGACKPTLILIDLRGCKFIDASVIAALIELQKGLDGAGSTLAVIARREPRRVLRLTAVDEVMPVFETMVDAGQTRNGAGRDRTAPVSASP